MSLGILEEQKCLQKTVEETLTKLSSANVAELDNLQDNISSVIYNEVSKALEKTDKFYSVQESESDVMNKNINYKINKVLLQIKGDIKRLSENVENNMKNIIEKFTKHELQVSSQESHTKQKYIFNNEDGDMEIINAVEETEYSYKKIASAMAFGAAVGTLITAFIFGSSGS